MFWRQSLCSCCDMITVTRLPSKPVNVTHNSCLNIYRFQLLILCKKIFYKWIHSHHQILKCKKLFQKVLDNLILERVDTVHIQFTEEDFTKASLLSWSPTTPGRTSSPRRTSTSSPTTSSPSSRLPRVSPSPTASGRRPTRWLIWWRWLIFILHCQYHYVTNAVLSWFVLYLDWDLQIELCLRLPSSLCTWVHFSLAPK